MSQPPPTELESVNAYLAEENKQYGEHFMDLPKDSWVHKWKSDNGIKPFRIIRNKGFLVQLFRESGVVRMSVNRTTLKAIGLWDENITWEELQEVKRRAGYGEYDAVEVYPKDKDIINVANMRHLFVLSKHNLDFIWRK